MTIQQQHSKAVYIADGNTKNFVIPFIFFDDEIAVYLNNDTIPLKKETDYTVYKEKNNLIGEVIINKTPKNGEKITILRDVPLTQLVTFIEGEAFPATDYEKSLDKITMTFQMLKEILTRTFQLSPSSSLTSAEFEDLIVKLNNELDNIKKVPALASAVNSMYEEILGIYVQKKGPVSVETSKIVKSDTYPQYPYHLDIDIAEAKTAHVPSIVLSLEDAISGNFAPVSECFDGYVRIYLKNIPASETINIPIILLQ